VKRQYQLDEVLAASWPEVLHRVDDAVLVLDHERVLRFVNPRARQLLGYTEDQAIGSRCRLTTRGVDCEHACPLTYALEGDIDRVDDFSTVYRTRDGRSVPLMVTVIPLRDDNGDFLGAVEILRPREPEPGFFLVGSSPAIRSLKSRLVRIGRDRHHLLLVGPRAVRRDLGRAVHRFAGLPDELFEVWEGSWDEVSEWPPGTMYADGDVAASLVGTKPPEGWQVVVGVDHHEPPPECELTFEVVELPSVEGIRDDLELIVAAWVDDLAPGTTVAPGALQQLARLARNCGFDGLERALVAAVAAATDRVENEHVPADGYGSHLVDELLRTDNPLAALECRLLTEVLHRSGWKMQEAAERLGVSRVTLWRKLKDHGIERPGCNGGE
jgi:PAS domain S-box-containing protein